MIQPRPLDIVRTPGGGIAMVSEISPCNSNGKTWPTRSGQAMCSIDYLDNPAHEKNAWWFPEQLTVLGNLPALISKAMCHPFGTNQAVAVQAYETNLQLP